MLATRICLGDGEQMQPPECYAPGFVGQLFLSHVSMNSLWKQKRREYHLPAQMQFLVHQKRRNLS